MAGKSGNGGGRTRSYAPRMAPDDRRRQLLDAALGLIAEEGYAAVTIEAVANRVGVTRPVVYSVFANVDELLVTLLDRHEARTMAEVRNAVEDRGEGPGALVRHAMAEFLQSIDASPDGWKVILQAEDSAAPEEVRRRNRHGRERVTRLLANNLEASFDGPSGQFDTEMLAEAVITLAHRGGTLMLEDPERYPLDRMILMAEGLARPIDDLAQAAATG